MHERSKGVQPDLGNSIISEGQAGENVNELDAVGQADTQVPPSDP